MVLRGCLSVSVRVSRLSALLFIHLLTFLVSRVSYLFLGALPLFGYLLGKSATLNQPTE